MTFARCDDEWLANELIARFGGRTVSVAEVRELVVSTTPMVAYKPALQLLEKSGRLRVVNPPPGRRARRFPDSAMQLAFARPAG